MDGDVRMVGVAVRVSGDDSAEGATGAEPARDLRIGRQRQLRIRIGLLQSVLLARGVLLPLQLLL